MECSFPFVLWRFLVLAPAPGSLPALLASIPDPRGRQGLRHPSAAMLAATVCGILTGARGCDAIAQWVRNQEAKIWHLLGYRRKPPCANTYRNVLARIPPEILEAIIAEWIGTIIPDPPPNAEPVPVALDGKTLCGTLDKHSRSIHLLALFDHKTGGVLRQLAMPPDTNEHKAALQLLKKIVLKGRVITADAMFCQRDLCQQIVDSGGDYLIAVKDNQPELKAAIEAEFQPGFSPL
jgi:DDE_Tnp_1-associated/Transposase DDE domain